MAQQGNQDYPLVCCEQGDPGCAGLVVNKIGNRGTRYLLSAAHVLSTLPFGVPSRGDPVFAVQNFNGDNPRRIGVLSDWIEITTRTDRQYIGDLALAALSGSVSPVLPGGIGIPAGVNMNRPPKGSAVKIYSVAGGAVRTSIVAESDYSDSLHYSDDDGNQLSVRFRNVVLCRPAYSEPGDSGSVVLNDDNEVVGIHFWGGPNESIFAPIGDVVRTFSIEMFTGGVPVGAPAPPVANVAGTLAPAVGNAADALDVLARTLFGEARGEGDAGIAAVGCVVANRARRRPAIWWGDTVEAVCRKPFQFSCWNQNDPNLPRLKSVGLDDAAFVKCHAIAQDILAGRIADTTNGATHYHAVGVSPAWMAGRQPCAVIGQHRFYNNIT